MSLLNDALKRAKLEALQREAEGGSDYGLPTPRAGRKTSMTTRLLLVVGVVGLAAFGASLGWWLARTGAAEGSQSAVTETQSAQAPAGATASGESPIADSPQPGRRASAERAAAGAAAAGRSETSTSDERTASADGPSPQRPGSRPRQRDAQADTAAAEIAPEAGRSTLGQEGTGAAADAPSTLADGASFVRVLELDGVRLELQGIAFQGGSSVAIINDLMVGPGDMVGGFEIVGIEPERVQLQGRGVTLYLALH